MFTMALFDPVLNVSNIMVDNSKECPARAYQLGLIHVDAHSTRNSLLSRICLLILDYQLVTEKRLLALIFSQFATPMLLLCTAEK